LSKPAAAKTVATPDLTVIKKAHSIVVAGGNFSVEFNRGTGMPDRYAFKSTAAGWDTGHTGGDGGGDILAPGNVNSLQLWRAPTDNDKGFGKWLARDWREAGLTNLTYSVEKFELGVSSAQTARITSIVTGNGTGGGVRLKTTWTVHSDGTIDMEADFQPIGKLPPLPRVGLVFCLNQPYENLKWYGRGPWENYSDRKASADMGVWRSTVSEQYVSYVRPQDNGNKEDTRWLELTDTNGYGLKITSEENPFAFSALHFTTGDLSSVRHNYELQSRPEVILSLDAKMSGLGNSSCGPGVLEKYSVPPQDYRLHLKFSPVSPTVEK
jgi:beta-galactosidase